MRNSSLKHSGTAHVNERSHSFTCRPHVCPQVVWTIPAFTSQLQSITTLWPVLIFRPAECRRLSWPEWLVTHRGGLPPACICSPILTGPGLEYFVDRDQRATTKSSRHQSSFVSAKNLKTVSYVLLNQHETQWDSCMMWGHFSYQRRVLNWTGGQLLSDAHGMVFGGFLLRGAECSFD